MDRPAGQQQSNRSPVHHAKKESPTPVAPSRSPQIQRKVAKCEPIQQSSKQSGSVAGSSNEEQWIDGPRFNKTRISQARMQVVRHQREMWVDGPPTDAAQVLPTPAVLPTVTPTVNQAPLGYGFMDQHKQGMIRQWVENQSVQVKLSNCQSFGVPGYQNTKTKINKMFNVFCFLLYLLFLLFLLGTETAATPIGADQRTNVDRCSAPASPRARHSSQGLNCL